MIKRLNSKTPITGENSVQKQRKNIKTYKLFKYNDIKGGGGITPTPCTHNEQVHHLRFITSDKFQPSKAKM